MKIEMREITEYEAVTLKVKAGVRYWEDAYINGGDTPDTDGLLIPCRDGDYWCPVIDIDRGVITNWQEGVTADIHYKICDDGEYWVLDANGDIIHCDSGCYVPYVLDIPNDGCGDYIIMKVGKNGEIENWNAKRIQSFIGDID